MPFELNNTIKFIAILFLFVVAFGAYIVSTRLGSNKKVYTDKKVINTTNTQQKSSAYFIPPSSPYKEVKLTGRVEKSLGEKPKATHVLMDKNNNVIVFLYTDDDKLTQQEGNRITLVGQIPYSSELNPESVVFVKYILFK